MRWTMVGTPFGLTLFTADGLPFNGSTNSIPFSNGTVLAGPDPFNVYLDDPALGNPLVVMGQDRTLTAVPEPNSAILAGLAFVAVGAIMARRRICSG